MASTRLSVSVKTAVSSVLASIYAEAPRHSPERCVMGEDEYQAWACELALTLLGEECQLRRCEAQGRRNSSVLLHQLPPEIFGQILLISLTHVSWLDDLRRIRRVSRLWKSVVDSTPLFWAHIDQSIHASRSTSTFLRNSKSAPLDIRCVVPLASPARRNFVDFLNDFLRTVNPHIDHFRSLEIKDWLHTEQGLALFRSNMPALEELVLTVANRNGTATPFTLPTTPSLRKLSLAHMALRKMPTSCPKLRSLELIDIRDPPPVGDVVTMLSTLPLLQKIVLRDWSWSQNVTDVAHARLIKLHLSNLITLILHSMPRSLTHAILEGANDTNYRCFEVIYAPLDFFQSNPAPFASLFEAIEWLEVETLHRGELTIHVTGRTEQQQNPSIILKIRADSYLIRRLEAVLGWLSAASPSTPIRFSVGHIPRPLNRVLGEEVVVPCPPLTLTRAPIQGCPSLSYLRTGINVNIDDVLEYLAKPTQKEDGTWEWPCPHLKEVDIKLWRGRERSLYHTAWARWEVPSDRAEGPVPRKQLERLIQPLKISRDLANLMKRCALNS